MPYEDDIRDDESFTSTLVWTISVAMFAAAAAIMWFAIVTH